MINRQGFKCGFQIWQLFLSDIPDDAGINSAIVVAQNAAELADSMKVDIIRHGWVELMSQFTCSLCNSFQASFNGIDGHPVTGEGFIRVFSRVLLNGSNVFRYVMDALGGPVSMQ